MSRAPREDFDEGDVQVGRHKDHAAGVPAVYHSLKIANEQMGAVRSARTLLRLNQKDGFDCPGCAWPEKDHRHIAEFCENGAKAVAEEATKRTIGAEFFARHPVSELAQKTDWWLGQQGRLVEPLIKPAGEEHYRPIAWDAAFDLIATELRGLESRTGPPSTPPAGPATRPRSSTSCSSGSSAPTTCRTARTCATSPPGRR